MDFYSTWKCKRTLRERRRGKGARERQRQRGEHTPEVRYTDFHDHAVDYDSADAQIVRHLVSQSQNVTFHAPLTSIQYPDLTRPLGYYEAVARPLGLLRYIKRDRRNRMAGLAYIPRHRALPIPFCFQRRSGLVGSSRLESGALLSPHQIEPSRIVA